MAVVTSGADMTVIILDENEAQVLTYLRFSSCQLGLLINFRTRWLKDGVRRLAL